MTSRFFYKHCLGFIIVLFAIIIYIGPQVLKCLLLQRNRTVACPYPIFGPMDGEIEVFLEVRLNWYMT